MEGCKLQAISVLPCRFPGTQTSKQRIKTTHELSSHSELAGRLHVLHATYQRLVKIYTQMMIQMAWEKAPVVPMPYII